MNTMSTINPATENQSFLTSLLMDAFLCCRKTGEASADNG
jgi:hypothetical protein